MVVELRLYCNKSNEYQIRDFPWFTHFERFYIDNGVYGIQVSPYTQFYCKKTGETLCVNESCILAILERKSQEKAVKQLTKRKKVCGFVECINDNVTTDKGVLPPLFYSNIIFYFRDRNFLTPCNRECGFLIYAKKYNSRIRSIIPNFPTFEQLEKVTNSTSSRICLRMYEQLDLP